MPLIGIAGAARSGKDTVAALLTDELTNVYKRESFADPLRGLVAEITGINVHDLMDGAVKEQVIPWIGKSPRQMMQTLGSEWGRDMVNENLWVLTAMKKVERNRAAGKSTVIADVRFDNEARAVRAHGGVVLHIVRPDALQVSGHKSEAGVTRAPQDPVLINDGSLADLRSEVDRVLYALWQTA